MPSAVLLPVLGLLDEDQDRSTVTVNGSDPLISGEGLSPPISESMPSAVAIKELLALDDRCICILHSVAVAVAERVS
jgi:hypothetical protein